MQFLFTVAPLISPDYIFIHLKLVGGKKLFIFNENIFNNKLTIRFRSMIVFNFKHSHINMVGLFGDEIILSVNYPFL